MLDRRQKLKTELKKQQEEEAEMIQHMKNLLKNRRNTEDAEEAFKKKSERILEAFKEEALAMDKKIYQLQEENNELKSRVKFKMDDEIVQYFQEFEEDQTPEVCENLCYLLTEKLELEKEQRLKTEQQAAEMIAEVKRLS